MPADVTVTPPRRHGRDILDTVVGSAFAPLVSLATAPLLAQGLGVVGRGEVAAAVAPLLFAQTVGALGLPDALIHCVARSPVAGRLASRRVAAASVVSGIVVAALIYLLAGPLSSGNAGLAGLIRISAAAAVPTLLLAVPRAVLAGAGEWRLIAWGNAVAGLVRLGWVGLLVTADALSPIAATAALVIAPMTAALIYLPRMRSVLGSPERPVVPATAASWSSLGSFGLRIWLGSLSGIVLIRMAQLLMVPLSTEAQAGIFVVAVSLGEIPLVISGSVRDVTFTAESGDSTTDRLQQSARVTFAVTAMVSLGLAATFPVAIPLFFGEAFAPAVGVAALILVGTTIGSTGSVAGAALSARGRPGLRSLSMFWGAIGNVVVLLVTVPTLGAVGGALATIVGSGIAGSMNVLYLHRRCGVPAAGFYGLRSDDLSLLRLYARRLLGRLSSGGRL